VVAEIVKYEPMTANLIIIFILYFFVFLNNEINAFENQEVKKLDNMSLYSLILMVFLGMLFSFNNLSGVE